jgi:hypothetical protein
MHSDTLDMDMHEWLACIQMRTMVVSTPHVVRDNCLRPTMTQAHTHPVGQRQHAFVSHAFVVHGVCLHGNHGSSCKQAKKQAIKQSSNPPIHPPTHPPNHPSIHPSVNQSITWAPSR